MPDGRLRRTVVACLWVGLTACSPTGSTPVRSPAAGATSSSTVATTPAVASGASSESAAAGPRPLSPGTLRSLRKQGFTITVLGAERVPRRAVRASQRAFGSLHDGVLVEVGLARVTISDYGPVHDGRVDPIIEDRRVWLVVVDGFTQLPVGPIQLTPDPDTEPRRSARLVNVVDARTLAWLSAETV